MTHFFLPPGRVRILLFFIIFLLFVAVGSSMAEENPIIRFDLQGGQTPRINTDPYLLVFESGRGFIGSPYGISNPIEFQLTQGEIKDILAFIIDENHFFDIDEASIQEKIKNELNQSTFSAGTNSRRVFALRDATTTIIQIAANGKEHAIEFYALSSASRQFPDIIELTQLLAVQKYLQDLISNIRADTQSVP